MSSLAFDEYIGTYIYEDKRQVRFLFLPQNCKQNLINQIIANVYGRENWVKLLLVYYMTQGEYLTTLQKAHKTLDIMVAIKGLIWKDKL